MRFQDLTQLDLLCTATRFEVPGAILRKRKRGDWIVTTSDGTNTSRHDKLDTALPEFCRLSEVWQEQLLKEARKRLAELCLDKGTEVQSSNTP